MSDKDTIAALQRNLAAAEVERLRLVAEVERLCNRLGDKSEATSAALADAFTKGTLAAGDAMRERLAASEAEVERLREALRDVAERQREACADSLCGTPLDGLHMRVRATPLVTEEEP